MTSAPQARRRSGLLRYSAALLLLAPAFSTPSGAAPTPRGVDAGFQPADEGQRPRSTPEILPAQFLRGYDPITVYFGSNVGPGRGDADDASALLRISPPWPGAYFWADRQTLQFRPAEPWPALARFEVEASRTHRVLTTLMSAPTSMAPASNSDNLLPFRALSLTFPQALPLESLRQMISLEVRDRPGLADSPHHAVEGWTLVELPRQRDRDPATYALTLPSEIPEGKLLQVQVSLSLGDQDKVLWVGRASTRLPFHLAEIACGGQSSTLGVGGSNGKTGALACGNRGETPQLVFSSNVKDLTLTDLMKLVKLEPAVADLHFEVAGPRVVLHGRFLPDVLYQMRLGAAPLHDESDRALEDPHDASVYFYLGARQPFLRWSQSSAVLEANGPRMVPLMGYGDARADVRIYRIDPLHTGLWPFTRTPLTIGEEEAPPFPGEEPALSPGPETAPSPDLLKANIRLLGSPLVSQVVDLPLGKRSENTRFGLDLAPLLDPVIGKNQPGTYLVGVRRLSGPATRDYVRVQVTNLSMTTVEEGDHLQLFVRTLDTGAPVSGATVGLDGMKEVKGPEGELPPVPAQKTWTTDGQGRVDITRIAGWTELRRLWIRKGADTLVINPAEPPPSFANNHGFGGGWLRWLTENEVQPPANDGTLGWVFTERPIYRPGEKVYIKGYLRNRHAGALENPGSAELYGMEVEGPDGQKWPLPVQLTPLAGFQAEYQPPNPATGDYRVRVFVKKTQLELASRSFQIQAYRIPTFEVRFTGETTVGLDGPFKVKALARYYAGGSVAGQPIQWTVTQRPYYHVPEGRAGFLFASSNQFARPGAGRSTAALSREAELDDSGSDQLTINPALDVDASPRVYTVEATVTGPDGQPVTSTEEITALPPFVMGMKLPRYSEKLVNLHPEIIAVGVKNQLLAGQEVMVRLYHRIWHTHLRETNFATGESKYVTEQEDQKVLEKTVKTLADKPVIPEVPIRQAGVYVVELTSRDKLGRVQTLSADLYVGGPEPMAWRKSKEGVFEVTPDKKSYRPGDTARLVVQSPFQSAHALAVIERPGGNAYAWLEVSGGKLVIPVKVNPQDAPNLPVHVVLMRGRLAERDEGGHAADDSRYRPQTVVSSLEVEVEPTRNLVSVKLEHPDTARPGTRIEVAVDLQDDEKHPLAGEVTLWLVDEAVLSLAKEEPFDPVGRFVPKNSRVSSIRDSRNTIVGRLLEQEEPGGDGEGAGDLAKGRSPRVRKSFKTVPYYAATLQVPASGRLVVPIDLSDDLTDFKVRAVAASGLARFGVAADTLHVRLPVVAQPQLPRLVRAGDRFWGGTVARLVEGAEGPGTTTVQISGPVSGNGGAKAVTLSKTQADSVVFPFTVGDVPAGAPSEIVARAEVVRKSDGIGDAFESRIPVLPDQSIETFAVLQHLAVGPVALPPFPEPIRPGTGRQRLTASNIPGVLQLAAGLDYLADYPHGCLEQRLSQVMPGVTQGALLASLGLAPTTGSSAALRAFLDELGTFQDGEGRFAYWPGTPGDLSLTASVVSFLAQVRKAGTPIDPAVWTRAVEALERSLRSDYGGLTQDYGYDERAVAVLALAASGKVEESYLIDLYHSKDQMDLSALASLTDAMADAPAQFGANLASLKGDLWKSAVFQLRDGKPMLARVNFRRDRWSGSFLESRPSSVAELLQSLSRVDPTNPQLDLIRDNLLSTANAATGFGNTFENRLALGALTTYLEAARPSASASQLHLGDQSIALDAQHKAGQVVISRDTPVSGTVEDGPAEMRVAYAYVPAGPGSAVKPSQSGFVVSRSMTVYPLAGGDPQSFDDAPGKVVGIPVGSVVEVHTQLTLSAAMSQVALVVPFAAGFEPMNPELKTSGKDAQPSRADSLTPSHVQRLDGEARYYFLQLAPGTYAFHFRVRASTEGAYVHPAPWAEEMYHPEVRGRGAGMRVLVTGAHEKGP